MYSDKSFGLEFQMFIIFFILGFNTWQKKTGFDERDGCVKQNDHGLMNGKTDWWLAVQTVGLM